MLKEAASLICKNKLVSMFACLLVIDAAAVVGGLAAHSSWFVEPIDPKGPSKYGLNYLGIAHVVLWTIGPPIWFFLETYTRYAKLLPSIDHSTKAELKAGYDRLRLAQDLASKVWAAVLAAILFLVPKS